MKCLKHVYDADANVFFAAASAIHHNLIMPVDIVVIPVHYRSYEAGQTFT